MKTPKEPYVVLLKKTPGGLEYDRDCYDLSDLGILPSIGDHIVSPGVLSELPRVPANRTVATVVARYFQPRTSEHASPHIVLVVKERRARDDEGAALGE